MKKKLSIALVVLFLFSPMAFGCLLDGDCPISQMCNKGPLSAGSCVDATTISDPALGQGTLSNARVVTDGAGVAKNALLIRAWNPDGTVASINDFVNYTHYIASDKWGAYANYGVFPMGNLPASAQIGSDISSVNIAGTNYITISVPTNKSFYFISLWKAPTIGTVFMRADNKGLGYNITDNGVRILKLPYDFALSEYHQAQTLLPNYPLSPEAKNLLSKATAALDAARRAATPSKRAKAAYRALSFIMPLKERLVLDEANRSISLSGKRPEFDLNFEGFGSWVDNTQASDYSYAKQAGFSSVFTCMEWDKISPTQGTYDFTMMDQQIDRAQQLGFKVGLVINDPVNLPQWAKNLSFSDLKTLYYENARIVVARYGSKVSWYYPAAEMELERGTYGLAEIAELARQALNGARAAAPTQAFGLYMSASAYVSYQMNVGPNPGYLSGLNLLSYLSQNNINFDFLGLEMQYGTVFAPIDLQRFRDIVQEVHKVVNIPIYMGETGYSSKTEDYGIAGPFYWHSGLTQQAQAEWADATLRILYGMPFVKGYYWVHLSPDNYDYGSDFLSSLVGTNIVRADGSIKKVYSAFKDFTSQIDNYRIGSFGAPVSVVATGGDAQSTRVNTWFPSALQVIVRDFLGNPVPNVTVIFTTPSSGAGGTFRGTGLSASATTDSSGLATSSAFLSNGTVGHFNVTASVIGVPTQATFTLLNTN